MTGTGIMRPCPRCDGLGAVLLRLVDLGPLDAALLQALGVESAAGRDPIYSSDLQTTRPDSNTRYRALLHLIELGLIDRAATGTSIRQVRPPRYRYWLTADGRALLAEEGLPYAPNQVATGTTGDRSRPWGGVATAG